jgi:hypothetical protein
MKLRTIATATVLMLTLAACADASTGSGGTPSSPAGGADHLVLRVSYEGGFVPPEVTLAAIPSFSLFADGTIITPGAQIELYPGPALPAIQTRTVTPEGVQAIVQAARDAGVTTARDMTDFGSVGIADAATTVLTLEADGTTSTVRVYALGDLDTRPQGMSAEEFQARMKLASFVGDLSTPESWLPAGALGDPASYTGTQARLFVSDYQGDPQLDQERVAWPLPTSLSDIGKATMPSGFRCAVVDGDAWTATLMPAAAQANQLTPWTEENASYAIVFRPLLPDEHDC